ncbi:NAD(P)/FAD-dependent oxidoreductase [Calothrix sp. PCC 6303]|uniref:NAD(P)/FAD-dependent oxidoreductase n=1 Tax=Calothrix sp. PCC 6303 TaxID=1170562 RepID=UPI0002A032D0|nr:FAD-binding oxidoreductase [Calothrix sp. PCC 6303]AFZ02584.1 FAD dependent oxidoreductase [Calothrix sp. PCC 6303]
MTTKIYDWIVIGGGFAGAALAYELVKKDLRVLLLEQNAVADNATRYSYGGLAFWSGATPLTRQLCDEGLQRYQVLADELATDIEFRQLDLLLTIGLESDVETVAKSYSQMAIPPRQLTVKEASELEPLLNSDAISGALTVKHGHIHPEKTAQAYIDAFLRDGGELKITQVLELFSAFTVDKQALCRVKTATDNYEGENIAVCAGGISRQLLKTSGIETQIYFTHAEIIEIQPVDFKMNTLVMPASLQRFQLEFEATRDDKLWQEPSDEEQAAILDVGAVQFRDGSLRLGQISRIITNPNAKIDSKISEEWMRCSIRADTRTTYVAQASHIHNILPKLAHLPGTWHHCLVAFSKDNLPVIGKIPDFPQIHLFSGFSNPLVFIPPLAQHFANWVSGTEDEIINQLSPSRFR